MSQITIYLSDNNLQVLKKISNDSEKSISKISAEFIEDGIKLYQNKTKDSHNNNIEKMDEYEKKHHVSMIVTLNIAIEILKKLKKEPSQYDDKNIEYMLACFKNTGYESLNNM